MDRECVTLLAEYRYDTSFIQHFIWESRSFLNIIWLGSEYRSKIMWLFEKYKAQRNIYKDLNMVIVHRTPSLIFDEQEMSFQNMILPNCEEYQSLVDTLCRFEMTTILKYVYRKIIEDHPSDSLSMFLRKFSLDDTDLEHLKQKLFAHNAVAKSTDDLYNEVACSWLKDNVEQKSRMWFPRGKMQMFIGGIYPIKDNSRGHQGLWRIVKKALEAINHSHILHDYELKDYANDGNCKANSVLQIFLHYFQSPRVLGILGPACSETVEPVAGLSKHTRMAVISYSAEGGTYMDRNQYPYFFRTIGSNRQYEDVYISLMKLFGWRRVAALTEDGQKYTEYISHMEASIKQNQMELIINKKFLSEVTSEDMNKVSLGIFVH